MTKKKLPGGAARIKAKGLKGVSLAMKPETKEILEQAAKLDGRSLTQFLIYHGIREATKILSKNNVS